MSRFKAGGFAVIMKGLIDLSNVGKVIQLISFEGLNYAPSIPTKAWRIKCESGLVMEDGEILYEYFIEEYRLLPLGDKQTQLEFHSEEAKY